MERTQSAWRPVGGDAQIRALSAASESVPAFDDALAACGLSPFKATGLAVLQVNVGRRCTLACRHCHVEAGPDRAEAISRDTLSACLAAVDRGDIPTIDITGGAPELHPDLRWFVGEVYARGRRVVLRTNLAALDAPDCDDLPAFLATHGVEIIASLPCYTAGNTDAQRGRGTFDRSIRVLRRLNAIGFGVPGGMPLVLVHNPGGATLPPPQEGLETAYRERLRAEHGVEFTALFTMANMPIGRFLASLVRTGDLAAYLARLRDAFNPVAAARAMCRTMLSVRWDGGLADCDFNQMLDMPLVRPAPRHIADFDPCALATRRIATGPHCWGCAAGAGSSCGGALAREPDGGDDVV